MASSWPPTPSVEDEEAALAREYGLDPVTSPVQSNEEPQLKGTVDQYPIILDVHPPITSRNDSSAIESDREHSSSDESRGPLTPTTAHSEQRFVLLDHDIPKKTSPAADCQLPRSEDPPRGRPYISPIRTNIGNDLNKMATGHQRSASPYSSRTEQPLMSPQPQNRFSGDTFLSPQHASSDEYYRARSTGRKVKHEDARCMTDPDKLSENRRHHSRRRRESDMRTARPSLEKLVPAVFDRRSVSYTATDPIGSMRSSVIKSQAREDPVTVDAVTQKRASRNSPYSSAVEEKTRRHRSKSRRRSKSRPRTDKTTTRESPYTSSSEESRRRAHRNYRVPANEGKLSRRSSTVRRERPPVDISDQHYSYGVGDPLDERFDSSKRRSDPPHRPVFDSKTNSEASSTQTPEAMEDYFAKAFEDNSLKFSHTLRASPNTSPFTSHPHSPPRTPRRIRSSKDYSDLESGIVKGAPKSRQASGDDSLLNVLRPLVNISAAAVGASRTIPNLSRSSTAPMDTPSQGSSSKALSSGQRSRPPSPVQEDIIRPVSRISSFDVRDDRPLSRVSTSASNEPRKHQRIPTVVTEASSSNEYRPSSRAGHIGLEAPRPITRAYSTAADEVARPPSAYRAMSSGQVLPSPVTEQWRPYSAQRTTSNYNTPTSATSSFPLPFSAPRPMTFTPVPVQGPPAPVPLREPAPVNLPPCPRSTPKAGYHDWYTVSQVTDINICPTCMSTLGSSRFRDIFAPSFSSPNREIRCAMSQPWLRIAFIQAVKQRRTPQEMTGLLKDLLHLPEGTRPCAGKESETRKWYQLIDPFDGSTVPGFEVCTHCVRNVDLVFPHLRGIFTRTTSLLQERVCNLNTQSKRFPGYIEQLDKAASRFDAEKSLKKPDVQDLARYARRVANIHDCTRDNMMFSAEWHFMSKLPEFTVCPECFEEVVRPVYDRPLANAIPKKPRLLPISQESRYVQAGATSCQLYSARMRKVFQDALRNSDFDLLRDAAVKRHNVEIRCQARHRELMQEIKAGYDRAAEVRRNMQMWQNWE